MEIWVCSMTVPTLGETIVLGTFSDYLKAEEQARIWVNNRTDFNTETIDRSFDRINCIENIYYRAKMGNTYHHYTAQIERFFLDRLEGEV